MTDKIEYSMHSSHDSWNRSKREQLENIDTLIIQKDWVGALSSLNAGERPAHDLWDQGVVHGAGPIRSVTRARGPVRNQDKSEETKKREEQERMACERFWTAVAAADDGEWIRSMTFARGEWGYCYGDDAKYGMRRLQLEAFQNEFDTPRVQPLLWSDARDLMERWDCPEIAIAAVNRLRPSAFTEDDKQRLLEDWAEGMGSASAASGPGLAAPFLAHLKNGHRLLTSLRQISAVPKAEAEAMLILARSAAAFWREPEVAKVFAAFAKSLNVRFSEEQKQSVLDAWGGIGKHDPLAGMGGVSLAECQANAKSVWTALAQAGLCSGDDRQCAVRWCALAAKGSRFSSGPQSEELSALIEKTAPFSPQEKTWLLAGWGVCAAVGSLAAAQESAKDWAVIKKCAGEKWGAETPADLLDRSFAGLSIAAALVAPPFERLKLRAACAAIAHDAMEQLKKQRPATAHERRFANADEIPVARWEGWSEKARWAQGIAESSDWQKEEWAAIERLCEKLGRDLKGLREAAFGEKQAHPSRSVKKTAKNRL